MEFSFYALRFLLGIAEAGFFPGIILYLTYWFPATRRARSVSVFMTAVVVANVLGAPLSGAIMQYADGVAGWPGWRWLFMLEALPSVVAGWRFSVWLPDGPSSARWLTVAEREAIKRHLATDNARSDDARSAHGAAHGVRAAFSSGRVWALAFVYLAAALALYGVNFWMPTIIQELGIARTAYLQVGLASTIPWGLAGVVMLMAGAHSDRTGERRWHVAGALLVTAAGLTLLAVVGRAPLPSMIALSLVTCGVMSSFATFWAIPTSLLRQSAAAAGIAWINSVGNLGGHFGPDLIGRVRDATGSSGGAFLSLAAVAALGAVALLLATRRSAML